MMRALQELQDRFSVKQLMPSALVDTLAEEVVEEVSVSKGEPVHP